MGYSAIGERWRAGGSESGPLGIRPATEQCLLSGGGCSQSFAGGAVVWSPATGARAVRTAVLDAWTARGGVAGLGYPLTDTVCGLRSGGCYQLFQKGSVYYSSGTPAAVVLGGIRDRWAASGLENGPLGYPTGNEQCGLAGGGCSQSFVGGAVLWSGATGARTVRTAVLDAWTARGGVAGLGYPLTDTVCGLRSGGCYQLFQKGSVYYSSGTPAAVVLGGIRDRWAASGLENGPLGYPTGNEQCGLAGGGCSQSFVGGAVLWSGGPGHGPCGRRCSMRGRRAVGWPGWAIR